jgi:hypothetical protein
VRQAREMGRSGWTPAPNLGQLASMRVLLILSVLLAFVAPAAAFGQNAPPLPLPRPDFAPASAAPGPAAPVSTPALANTKPQPVTLSARVSDQGPIIPSGLIWRVYNTQVDAQGRLKLVAKSKDAAASLALPPGEYVVHVAYGYAQASDTLSVDVGPNTKTIVLDAGALRLHAAITGDIAIADNQLTFDIFTTSESGSDGVPIARKVTPGQIVRLNAGVYHIVSHFGAANAVVRADLRVEPGQMTEATLYHRAARIDLRLVSQPNGEAIADVDWTVKTSNGDTVFTSHGAFPSVALEEGTYRILAKLGDKVYNRDLEVKPSRPRQVEVLTTVY